MVAATRGIEPVISRAGKSRSGSRGEDAAGLEVVVRGRWQPLSGPLPEPRPALQHWVRRFTGTFEQVGEARRFIEVLLADGGAVAADAGWVVGELAGNAVKHSRSGAAGGWFTVEVTRTRVSVDLRLIDAGGPGEPVVPATDPACGGQLPEAGLGLYGVAALASQYGTYPVVDGRRVVWARLPAAPPTVMGTT